MNPIKKMANAINTKTTAFAVAVTTMPVFAMANTDPAAVAAEKINALTPGVVLVGGAILALTLASVGFFVINRMAKRA